MDTYSDAFLEEGEPFAPTDDADDEKHVSFDEEAKSQDTPSASTSSRRNKILGLAAVLLMLIGAMIALTLGLVMGGNDSSDSVATTASPTPDTTVHPPPPTPNPIIDSTAAPTTDNTSTPSSLPCPQNASKCGFVMGAIAPVLPQSTRVDFPGTCQSWAREWLLGESNNDGSLPEYRIRQRYALAVIYCELNGNGWLLEDRESTWLSNLHECQWAMPNGINPCDHFGRFVVLHSFGNMTGSLPAELGLLTALLEVDLGNNNIHGTLPREFANAADLDTLVLPNNKLEGTIPEFVWKFEDAVHIDLHGNNFAASTIPTYVSLTAPNLRFLNLENSNIEGALSDDFAYLDWRILHLSGNHLEGPIPRSLFQGKSHFEELYLHNNSFSGEIPPDLGDHNKMTELTLYDNPELTGDINEICKNFYTGSLQLAQVDKAYVACECCRDGPINLSSSVDHASSPKCPMDPKCDFIMEAIGPALPPSTSHLLGAWGTCQNSALEWLAETNVVSNGTTANHFQTGNTSLADIPAYRLQQRFALAVMHCSFDNENWLKHQARLSQTHECAWYEKGLVKQDSRCDSSGKYQSFQHRGLYQGRRMFGALPPEISMVTSLKKLFLCYNRVSGTIPSEYAGLQQLSTLSLSWAALNGTIPDFVWKLQNLKTLDLGNNQLSGTLPETLNIYTPHLQNLLLGGNLLSSTIPVAFSFLNLTSLSLSHNVIIGTIPEDINGGYMQFLDLNQNQITGKIPNSIDRNGKLQYLDLSRNDFTGAIPDLNGTAARTLSFSWNQLSGTFPFATYPNLWFVNLLGNNITGDLTSTCALSGDRSEDGSSRYLSIQADIEKVSCDCCYCCQNETWYLEGENPFYPAFNDAYYGYFNADDDYY